MHADVDRNRDPEHDDWIPDDTQGPAQWLGRHKIGVRPVV